MKKTILKLFTVAVAAVMTATSFVGCGSGEGFAKDKYNIGVSGPLSGGAAVYGEAVKNGAELAVKEINEAGGIDGIKINFQMYDDKHDQTKVADGYAKQLEDGLYGIMPAEYPLDRDRAELFQQAVRFLKKTRSSNKTENLEITAFLNL